MKIKYLILFTTALAVMACSKNPGVSGVKGSYSFKTSGSVILRDSCTVTLPDESGQLQVIDMHDGNALCFTFNQILGHTYTTTGYIDGDEITLDKFQRQIGIGLHQFDINVTGKGKVYDDTIIFNLNYDGESHYSADTTLVSKSVTMVAKRN